MTTLRINDIRALAASRKAGAFSMLAILSVGVVGVNAHIPF